MAVPMSDEQQMAAGALLRERVPAAGGIGRLFARHGHELALVGGSIRDVFLGQQPTGDLDMATDATPGQVMALVSDWADATWTVGIAFGTVGLRKGGSIFEITTYRSEQYRATSRKPDVRYGRSLEQDLSRRDFTINAMAARLPGYEFVDLFGGLDALRERVLRTPGRPQDSFNDDPLRILRAARFAAKLDFAVADDVLAAMTEMAPRLEIVSAERIAELREQEEIDRLRPELDGNDIMRILGIPPGPVVGRAYKYLLELRITEGEIGQERVTQELLRWAAGAGITPPEPGED